MWILINGEDVHIEGYEVYEQDFAAVASEEYAGDAELILVRSLEPMGLEAIMEAGFSVSLFASETKIRRKAEFYFQTRQEDGEVWYEYNGKDVEGVEVLKADDIEYEIWDYHVYEEIWCKCTYIEFHSEAEGALTNALHEQKPQPGEEFGVRIGDEKAKDDLGRSCAGYVIHFEIKEPEEPGQPLLVRYCYVEDL